MPRSNDEAAHELNALRIDRDLSMAWIARRINRNFVWVARKLKGEVSITIDDYNLILDAILSVPVKDTAAK
ncbi:hypothetical protein [Leucobacter aridicollis]|uniref:hypothetical protein n=1 Tax=Leucobacter aridicollis TaxID=283878 RepID=UPI0021675A79|nr:hypothetical protein [Leucobacter aridicollis]MCS3427619.1 hypothetical protein [Leucobacter aridicollis]